MEPDGLDQNSQLILSLLLCDKSFLSFVIFASNILIYLSNLEDPVIKVSNMIRNPVALYFELYLTHCPRGITTIHEELHAIKWCI